MPEGFKVEAADFHRNGVGGEGFFVSIVNDDEHGRMLVIDFNTENEPGWHGFAAAVNLDEAAKGNIYMFPALDETGEYVEGTGSNAWRGADHFAPRYREAVKEFDAEQRRRGRLRWDKKGV